LLDMLRRHCFLTELTIAGPTNAAWADPAARVGVRIDGAQIGSLALLRPWVLRQAGIEDVQVAYAEFDLTPITAHRSRENQFAAIPDLPESSFDLSVVLDDIVTWGMLQEVVGKADPLIASLEYIGEYRPSSLSEGQRSLTLRLTRQPRDVTLTRGTSR
jgi:phenylalanyl-tRNA synthetase beta chain